MTGPPKKRTGLFFVILGAGLFFGLVVMFLAVWQFLAPADRRTAVAYSDFLEEVHAGHVDEIRVRGREIDYRLRPRADMPSNASGSSLQRETIGPVPDQAFLDSLKPTDPNAQPPKIHFEK